MVLGKITFWSGIIGYGIYLSYFREDNLLVMLLCIIIAISGSLIEYVKDPDIPDPKDVKRTRKSKGFDKEAFERYQCYLIATNKKRR